MACYRPVKAWRLETGAIFFGAEREGCREELLLPCGSCVGCRTRRRRSWALRCMHEAQMHDENVFVTLTYDEEHFHPSLNHLDFQKFVRRLRKSGKTVRYFMCGEYGDKNLRPHFHALLFGCAFRNLKRFDDTLFVSDELSKLWPLGFSSIGSVTFNSAFYVAAYSLKHKGNTCYTRVDKSTGEYFQVVPEYGRMSLKPGLGRSWFDKYWREVYVARNGVCLRGGQVVAPPRYYDDLLDDLHWQLFEEKKFDREVNARRFSEDCTPERLAVRELCAIAKVNFNKERSL